MKVDTVMKQKQLKLNAGKTGYLLLNNKIINIVNRKELSAAPLMCGEILTEEKMEDKYQGDMLSVSLSASVWLP